MIRLYDTGVYLTQNGLLSATAETMAAANMPAPAEAAKKTMAYGILEAHNTSGNMQDLQIKFDKLTSHDITFVGIIQTARASG
ncbi:MAG: hydratase, partial [Lachnospiraceae bacterium]|nr:hydratase [Lachnospiraceae bacterium]